MTIYTRCPRCNHHDSEEIAYKNNVFTKEIAYKNNVFTTYPSEVGKFDVGHLIKLPLEALVTKTCLCIKLPLKALVTIKNVCVLNYLFGSISY